MRRLSAFIVVAAVAAACSSNPEPDSRPRFDASLITRDAIQAQQFTTAYDAVKTLRGTWLNVKGPQSFRYPQAVQVYLDDVHLGDVSTLNSIAAPPIQFIRYYNAQEATSKWGIDHGAGAIYVSTRVGRAVPPA